MHVHLKARPRRAIPRRNPAIIALALATMLLAACSGDGPSVAPRPVRDGQLVQVSGTTEFSVRPARGAPARVIHRGGWTARGTMMRGVARTDFPLRALDRRVELDDSRAADAGPSSTDSATAMRILDRAGAMLFPALAIDERSKLATFGTGSVIESVLTDPAGRAVHIVGISDLPRGPLTDFLVVQEGRATRHTRIEWVKDQGVWHAVTVRATALLSNGSAMMAEGRTSMPRLAQTPSGGHLSFASLERRIEEIQFAALAKRTLLPAEAHAQIWEPYKPGGSFYDCSAFRNNLIPPDSPCAAYALNQTQASLGWLTEWIPAAAAARVGMAIVAGGEAAATAELAAAGFGFLAPILGTAITGAVLVTVGLYAYHFTECRVDHQEPARQCKATDPRTSTGSGNGGSTNDYGPLNDACGMSCDPSRRGAIDRARDGFQNAT